MSILKVARMGHPVLRAKAKAVPPSEITGATIQALIDNMIETMLEYHGVGLAAPQVHEGVRLFVAQIIDDDDEKEGGEEGAETVSSPASSVVAVINPEIVPTGRQTEEDWEGCLSIPDMRGRVSRHKEIKVRAYNREGQRIEIAATGYMARVMQHETDHLDGVLFLDRMKSLQSLCFIEEYARYHSSRDDE
jgi:peptide deformylase